MKTNMVHSLLPVLPDTSLILSMDRHFGRLIEKFFSDNSLNTQMEYKDLKDKYQLRVAVPGLSKNDLQLRLEDNMLYLSGYTRQTQQYKEASLLEQRRFERRFVLPSDGDPLRIKAHCRRGVLMVTLG
jgi:HSP20 family protein